MVRLIILFAAILLMSHSASSSQPSECRGYWSVSASIAKSARDSGYAVSDLRLSVEQTDQFYAVSEQAVEYNRLVFLYVAPDPAVTVVFYDDNGCVVQDAMGNISLKNFIVLGEAAWGDDPPQFRRLRYIPVDNDEGA